MATFHVADAQNLDLVLHGARAGGMRERPNTSVIVVVPLVAAENASRVDRILGFAGHAASSDPRGRARAGGRSLSASSGRCR